MSLPCEYHDTNLHWCVGCQNVIHEEEKQALKAQLILAKTERDDALLRLDLLKSPSIHIMV